MHTETGQSKDITRSAFNLFVWAQFELQAGIICASAPSLRVFFRRYLGETKIYGSRGKTRNTNAISTSRSYQINVKKDTSVTYEQQDSTESTESLTTPIDKMPSEGKSPWSPTGHDHRSGATTAATRYSHEEDYVMSDLSGRDATKEHKWSERA